jgi:hypothetical protein
MSAHRYNTRYQLAKQAFSTPTKPTKKASTDAPKKTINPAKDKCVCNDCSNARWSFQKQMNDMSYIRHNMLAYEEVTRDGGTHHGLHHLNDLFRYLSNNQEIFKENSKFAATVNRKANEALNYVLPSRYIESHGALWDELLTLSKRLAAITKLYME